MIGISDKLAGTVEGYVAAAAGLEELDAVALENFRRGKDVRAVVTRAHAERDDRRMFEQKELIGNPSRLALLYQLLLELERVGILHRPEPPDLELTPRRRVIRSTPRRNLPTAP